MVEQITFQTIFQFLQTAGILIGIGYYITTLRNAHKNRMIDLVFQRMNTRNAEYFKDSLDVNQLMFGWETVDEFHTRFNLKTTPELIAQRALLEDKFTAWGMLLQEGLVDIEFVAKVFPPAFVMTWWERNEPIYQEERKRMNHPEHKMELEFLYNKLRKRYPDVTSDSRYQQIQQE